MYLAGPPCPADDPGAPAGLRISRTSRRVFAGTSAAALHQDLRGYLTDLVLPYRLRLREDLLTRGSGQCYGEMGAALIEALVADGQPVDLLVLAFAMPDVRPERSTASYLSHRCPGDPMAFAVCDQGAAAAFTSLRLAGEYARTAECRRVLLLFLEQATLHHDPAVPAEVPARHAGVALLCERTGSARVEAVRLHADVGPELAGDVLAAELAAVAAGRSDVVLVLSRELARLVSKSADRPAGVMPGSADWAPDLAAAGQICGPAAGQPVTGVWWELAGRLPGWVTEGRTVLVADYERALRYLSVCVISAGAPAGLSPPLARRRAR